MIYFIQDTRSRSVKIGTSHNPIARLRELQTAHASPLVLLAIMDGGTTEERALHSRFTRLRGEWFEPTPELTRFIREHTMRMPQVRFARHTPVLSSVPVPLATEVEPIDLGTCGYPKREIWIAALLAVGINNGAYKFSSAKIAKLMTVGGTKAYREKMFSDIERIVFTIRSMTGSDVDRILMDAPPEIQEWDNWQRFTHPA